MRSVRRLSLEPHIKRREKRRKNEKTRDIVRYIKTTFDFGDYRLRLSTTPATIDSNNLIDYRLSTTIDFQTLSTFRIPRAGGARKARENPGLLTVRGSFLPVVGRPLSFSARRARPAAAVAVSRVLAGVAAAARRRPLQSRRRMRHIDARRRVFRAYVGVFGAGWRLYIPGGQNGATGRKTALYAVRLFSPAGGAAFLASWRRAGGPVCRRTRCSVYE